MTEVGVMTEVAIYRCLWIYMPIGLVVLFMSLSLCDLILVAAGLASVGHLILMGVNENGILINRLPPGWAVDVLLLSGGHSPSV